MKVDTLYTLCTSIYKLIPLYAPIYPYIPLDTPIYEHPVYKEGVTVLSMHEEDKSPPPYRQGALKAWKGNVSFP